MKNIAEFLTSLPATSKALSALFGVLCVGVVLGAVGVREIPANIKKNTQAIQENTALIIEHTELDGHDGVTALRAEFERAIQAHARQDSLLLAEVRRTNCFLANASEGTSISAAVRECGLR